MADSAILKRAKFIHKQTGYSVDDCMKMLRASEVYDTNQLLAGKPIKYGSLFTVLPVLAKPRHRYDINTGTKGYSKPKYKLKVRTHQIAQECLDLLIKKD